MKIDNEILGLRLEVVGLAAVMIASLWQFVFTDWFESQPIEMQNIIQEEVNLTILQSLNNISYQLLAEDETQNKMAFGRVKERTDRTFLETIEKRENRSNWMNGGQYKFFTAVKASLFVLGSILFVVGKVLVLHHVTSNKRRQSD